jgi:hypothetical protein
VLSAGGFLPLRGDGKSAWLFPFREDTDLGLRVVERVGPVPFDPGVVVWHPVESAPLASYLRTARYFVVDEAFARLHPGYIPALTTAPFARVRIRAACLGFAAFLALPVRRIRPLAYLTLFASAIAVALQVEHDIRRTGVSRCLRRIAVDAARRTPRALAWTLLAGAARAWGIMQVRTGAVPLRESSRQPSVMR